MAEHDEHDERDEREYHDPLLDDIDLKSIVEDNDDEETLRSQEELLGVTRGDSTNETQVTVAVPERPGRWALMPGAACDHHKEGICLRKYGNAYFKKGIPQGISV